MPRLFRAAQSSLPAKAQESIKTRASVGVGGSSVERAVHTSTTTRPRRGNMRTHGGVAEEVWERNLWDGGGTYGISDGEGGWSKTWRENLVCVPVE